MTDEIDERHEPIDPVVTCDPNPESATVLAIMDMNRSISGRLDRLNSRLNKMAATVHFMLETMHRKHIPRDGSPAIPWEESKRGCDDREETSNPT